MQSYYLSGSNQNVFRVESTTSPTFTMYYENMTTLADTTQSLSAEYTSSESIVKFTADISGAMDGDQYRAYMKDGVDEIVWNGTYQVIASSSLDKSNYVNQITGEYKSNVTTNEYIIY